MSGSATAPREEVRKEEEQDRSQDEKIVPEESEMLSQTDETSCEASLESQTQPMETVEATEFESRIDQEEKHERKVVRGDLILSV